MLRFWDAVVSLSEHTVNPNPDFCLVSLFVFSSFLHLHGHVKSRVAEQGLLSINLSFLGLPMTLTGTH